MFSDTFYKADKYNLNSFEYVSTYERMPWRYTGLKDSSYLPNFDANITAKLNRFMQFRFPNASVPLHDDNKVVSIEYVDSEVKSYYLVNPIKYTRFANESIWKYFVNFCAFKSLDTCKTTIDRLTDATEDVETDILGVHYDKDANYTGMRIFDPGYNLAEYAQNKKLNDINEFCKKYKGDCKGEIDTFYGSTDLRYTFKPFMPTVTLLRDPTTKLWNETCDNPLRKNLMLDKLLSADLISEEQKQFIDQTCVNRSIFAIDFIVSAEGELVDMFMRHVKITEFDDLTVG
jgi:hypothetical protein